MSQLEDNSDESFRRVWALVDSGSSVHAVNVPKVFPGARLEAPPAGARGFTCANGSTIPNKGTAVVPFRTDEGLKSAIQWKNADVELPILSTHELARNGRKLLYGEDGGDILHPDGKPNTHFVAAHDVYFMNMFVPQTYVQNKAPGLVCVWCEH